MFLWLLDLLNAAWPEAALGGRLGAASGIPFRGALAAASSLGVTLLVGPRLIRWLGRDCREPNTSDSARLRRLHHDKRATPTMGGLLILAGLIAALAAFGDPENRFLQAAVFVAVGLGLLGLVDDLAKLRSRQRGLSVRTKLAGQLLVAAIAATCAYHQHATVDQALQLRIPLLSAPLSLGAWFIPLAMLVIVGSSTAVNLTDGLDGLAGGCLISSVAGLTVIAYATGHGQLGEHFHVPLIPAAGEMAVLGGAVLGGLLGFLWFNWHPARVFMGDTGSLPLGGLLGLLAVATRQELLLLLIGGVFVVEAASVILQVGYYKWRKRRIFLCAPLHHHFQFLGWPEPRIVVRFWVASAACAVLGLAGLRSSLPPEVPRSAVSVRRTETSPSPQARQGLPPAKESRDDFR